ncbi:MAG: glycerol kinase, partial [Candidatus Omnitrophica bacterium]|nr:glycerol kinase [Candidatus Omnitrophota bacterium]
QVDGGAARNNWLMQFQADLLGLDVVRPALLANTAKGAALLAGMAIGWWRPSQLARSTGGPERVFHPRMARARRERLYAGWQEAVSRVRSRPA